jgi:hypothetical protein
VTEDPQPPRLQDTTERAALPLPLPGGEDPGDPVQEPSPDGSESTTDETEAVPEPQPLFTPPPAPATSPPAAAGNPHPEIMIGAAFLGGVALALLLKRLGS